MQLLKTENITVTRYATGSYVNGEYVKGSPVEHRKISCSIQPLSDQELQNLIEGDRIKRSKKLYTKFDMMIGDIVTYNSITFKVISVANNDKSLYTNNNKIIMIELLAGEN